jgi:hypothetical protein
MKDKQKNKKTPSIIASLGLTKKPATSTGANASTVQAASKTSGRDKVEQRIALLSSLAQTQASRELLSAARQGDLARVQYLVKYAPGCEVNFVSTASEDGLGKGATALHLAAYGNYGDVCEALLIAGAKAEADTANRSTALHVAVKKNAVEAVKVLLKAMTSEGVMKKDVLGNSALSYVKSEGVRAVFVRIGFIRN